MSVNGISKLNGYKPNYDRKTQENNQIPVSFGYGSDNYQSSVASEYIKKQQAQKQQMELEKQKKDKWKQFGMDVLKGVTIGAALIGGTALIASCTKAGKEMAQSLTNSIGLTSTDGSNKLNDEFAKKHPKVTKNEVIDGIASMPLSEQTKIACRSALLSANADTVSTIKSFKKAANSGILLYGLPGVGKSYSAKQFAEIFGAKYAILDVNSFKSAYVGESTKNIDRQIMPIINEAKEHPETPYFIIMDEADALLADTNDSSGTNNEMRSIFLQRMDVNNLPPNIKYILTTNYPEKITPAAIRTGRLQAIKVDNPAYDKLRDIYKNAISENFSGRFDDNELDEVLKMIPNNYSLLGPAHIKAVQTELNNILLPQKNDYKFTKDNLKTAFGKAHERACAEYFERCNSLMPSDNTCYEVASDEVSKARATNIAKICLINEGFYNDKNTQKNINEVIKMLVENIPIELMPKAIQIIKQKNGLTSERIYIDDNVLAYLLAELKRSHFKISVSTPNIQDEIDKAETSLKKDS